MARWLVHRLDWGVVSTTSVHLGGAAFGNPLSFADGPRCRPTGRLLFFLSPMDATTQARAHWIEASWPACMQVLRPTGHSCARPA